MFYLKVQVVIGFQRSIKRNPSITRASLQYYSHRSKRVRMNRRFIAVWDVETRERQTHQQKAGWSDVSTGSHLRGSWAGRATCTIETWRSITITAKCLNRLKDPPNQKDMYVYLHLNQTVRMKGKRINYKSEKPHHKSESPRGKTRKKEPEKSIVSLKLERFSLISELNYAPHLLQDISLITLQPELNFPAESSCIWGLIRPFKLSAFWWPVWISTSKHSRFKRHKVNN